MRKTYRLDVAAVDGHVHLEDVIIDDAGNGPAGELGNRTQDTAAGNIARCVLDSGARLYQLAPRLRDLDSVFRELTAQGGARHD